MKYLSIILLLLTGCASEPMIRMKNCVPDGTNMQPYGTGFWYCQPLPETEREHRK